MVRYIHTYIGVTSMAMCTVREEREDANYEMAAHVFKDNNLIAIFRGGCTDDSCIVTIQDGYTYAGIMSSEVRDSYMTIQSGRVVQVLTI